MSIYPVKLPYTPILDVYETQKAIGLLKNTFAERLSAALHLTRASAPLFVDPNSGLNDDLNGVERPVRFGITHTNTDAVIVHSLAKWKRLALKDYGFHVGEGIYTDMNAIRRDEELDSLHSIYVDQWDWEKVITAEDRTIDYLKATVNRIVDVICDTEDTLCREFRALKGNHLQREVSFITSQELEDLYPDLTPKERENTYVKEHPTTFLMQIGRTLRSGNRHDGRAPDYDDWDLNGDLLFWHDVLGCALEISSMGIRVDPQSLEEQLKLADAEDRKRFPFHKALLAGELPLTMGGGIGQSRLSMLLLRKAHIGEVQVSIWGEWVRKECARMGIALL